MKELVNTIQRDRTLERACDKAILTTLAYRSVFNSTLSFHQLATFLITDEEVDVTLFSNRLQNLLRAKKIGKKKGKYYLPGKKPLSWGLRGRYSMEHSESVQHAIKILGKIKWIKMLAITGSVAAHNAKKADDIDIFVITEKNRLWITRFYVVLLLKALNLYRSDKDSAGKICPNIFVDEDEMEWAKERRNIYIAHEVVMMHPIINRDNIYFKFIKKNDWVFSHFANFQIELPKRVVTKDSYNSLWLSFAEKFLRSLQQTYMKDRQTNEITTKTLIHFNKSDHSGTILGKFHKTLSV